MGDKTLRVALLQVSLYADYYHFVGPQDDYIDDENEDDMSN